MRNLVYLLLLIAVAVLMVGCASVRERAAYDDLAAIEQASYSADNGGYARRDLPVLTEESTLTDYLVYAVLNNAGLEAAFHRWKAALEKVPQARSLPDPRFNYSYFIEEVETRVGPQRQKFGVAQTFPWFGKRGLRGSVALEVANATRQRYEAVRLRVFYQVKNVYYEYYYLGRAIAVTEENIELLADLENVARTKYMTGEATHADVIKAQVELGKLEDRLSAQRHLRAPLVAKLNAALNRPADAPLPWPKAIAEQAVSFSSEQLFDWLKHRNPELRAIDFLAAKEKSAIDLARKDSYPDITLGVDYVDTDEALMPGTPDSGKDPVMAMLMINMPIWRGKYRAAWREASARYEAVLQERRDQENTLVADLEMALYGFRDAHRKINLYRDTLVPKAEQSLQVTRRAFEAGEVDFLNLIEAQRLLLEFRLLYERALVSRAQRLAELETLVGREIPRSETEAAEREEKKKPGGEQNAEDGLRL